VQHAFPEGYIYDPDPDRAGGKGKELPVPEPESKPGRGPRKLSRADRKVTPTTRANSFDLASLKKRLGA
jgi:hypothetical protein